MLRNNYIKYIFLFNYVVLFFAIALSLYYAYNLFLDLIKNSANKNLISINKQIAKNVNMELKYVSNSVKALGENYKKLHEEEYEYIKNKPLYEHKSIKNDNITFFIDYTDQNDFSFKSDNVAMILSNLNQDKETVARELNIFHQLTPALESIQNTLDFSWVYITSVNDFMLIYPYVPYENAKNIYKPTQQHFYKAANFKQKSVGWEEPYYDLAGDGVLVTASYPIYNKNENLLGVASHDITIDNIAKEILNGTTIYKDSVSFLISKQGKVISSTSKAHMQEIEKNDKLRYKGNFHYRTLRDAKQNGLDQIVVSSHKHLNKLGDEIISKIKPMKNVNTQLWNSKIEAFNEYILLVSQIPVTGWILVSYVPKDSIRDGTISIFYQIFLILSIFITTLFIFSAILAMRHLITPLEIINNASKRFGEGKTKIKVSYSNINLLKTLFETFNTMVDNINLNKHILEQKVQERTLKLQDEINRRKDVEQKLRKISRTDSLTEIWNRGYFFEILNKEVSRSHRYNINIALLMVDIDLFKKINDTYGHDIGDKAIKHVVSIINKNIRTDNVFGRLGGEEFGIIVTDLKNPDISNDIAKRLVKSVEQSPLVVNNESINITISISNIRKEDDSNTLYIRSDKALYLAKEKGRNRFEEI
ncbi:MAG: diguanylate cyclase [Thiovulaceae bacterium]|nr:diguanylate cyclase [Sulfurimonadaceae bacterium]